MPRARILSAALVATVLAVGASLAFREGAFYQRAAGVESLSGKARPRSAEDQSRVRGERERSEGEQLRQKIEHYLNKNGRAPFHLSAVLPLARGSHLDTLRQEILASNHEAPALALCSAAEEASEAAQRWFDRDPENGFAELHLIKARGPAESSDWSVLHLIGAAGKGYHNNYGNSCEKAVYDATREITGDLREAWRLSHETRMSLNQSDLLEKTVLHSALTKLLTNPDIPQEERQYVTEALFHLTDHAEKLLLGYTAARWGDFLVQTLPAEGFLSQRREDRSAFETRMLQWKEQHLWQSPLFLTALESASAEDLARMDTLCREKGIDAAKKDFWSRVNVEELKRKATVQGRKW